MEDFGFPPPQADPPRPRGSRWVLVGGVALVLALTLGVGALVGAALGSGNAQAASSTNSAGQAQTTDFAPGNADTPGRGSRARRGRAGRGSVSP